MGKISIHNLVASGDQESIKIRGFQQKTEIGTHSPNSSHEPFKIYMASSIRATTHNDLTLDLFT